MDPEAKKLTEEMFILTKDNNIMLHKIRRGQKWASFMRIMYWLIIIGVSVGSFYFLQPYVDQMREVFQSTSSTIDQFKKVLPSN